MPGFDRTGPRGEGPFTGRGLGPCGTGEQANRQTAGLGFGPGFRGAGFWRLARGAGRFAARCLTGGWGRGRRNRYLATGIPGWAWFQQAQDAAAQGKAAPTDKESDTGQK